ncbi:MAG: S8/S53 family peptidase [Actinomycetota bacterium]|nr:S8/S53 family peptidase [Actinomycetota bacterium]
MPRTLAHLVLACAVLLAATSSPAAALPAPATAGQDNPCRDPSHENYRTHACKVERLRERPFSVVAVIDSGINPYHVDFRVPEDEDLHGVHPSEFIEGYPKDAPALELTFDAPNLAAARSADQATWGSIGRGALVSFAGTNVIGAVNVSGSSPWDADGHGTSVASAAGGRLYGQDPDRVLLVSVSGGSTGGIRWAAEQPWIDAITNSYLAVTVPYTLSAATRDAVSRGKVVCFSSGNYVVQPMPNDTKGPSWHFYVGAVDHETRTEEYYSSSPADVMAPVGGPLATNSSLEATSGGRGTSFAAPRACGLVASTIAKVRGLLGDFREGPHEDRALAKGEPGKGSLDDGRLTRVEVEDALMATAEPARTLPAGHYVRGGYGIVDQETAPKAYRVIVGEAPRPDRFQEDTWHAAVDAARNALYPPP